MCELERDAPAHVCVFSCGEYLPPALSPALGRSWLVAPHHWLASSEDHNARPWSGRSLEDAWVGAGASVAGEVETVNG